MLKTESINKQIFKLSIPNIISNFSVPLLGAVDTALMGRLDNKLYLGALGLGSILFSFIYWGFGFIRMASTGLTAQAYGEDNPKECGLLLQRSIGIGIMSSLLLVVLQWFLVDVSFILMTTSPEVEKLTRTYFHIRIYAAPAALCLHAFHGVFLGLQNAKYPMVLTVSVNIVNIVLNIVFVIVLGMKIEGVAYATVIAQYVGLILAGIMFTFRYRHLITTWNLSIILEPSQLRRLLSISSDIFIRTLCLIFSQAYFMARSAALGDTVLAINTILLQYIYLLAYAIDGFAFAAESLIGKYKGAKDMLNLKRTTRQIFLWSFLFGGMFMIVFIVYGKELLTVFTDKELLIKQAAPYLIWIIIAPIVNVAAYIWDGIFLGATASKPLRDSMILTMGVFLIAVHLLAQYGNHGLWGALTLFLVSRGIVLTILSRRHLFNSSRND